MWLKSLADRMQNDLMSFLDRSRIAAFNDHGFVALRTDVAALWATEAAEQSDDDRALPMGYFRSANDVLALSAGREEDEYVIRSEQSLALPSEDLGKAEVVRDAGQCSRIGSEADRLERRPIRSVAADEFFCQMERFSGGSTVSRSEDGAASGKALRH